MSFGTFPGVGLKAAREKRHNAEKLLDQGQDPVAVREAKRQEDEKLKHTFRAVGEEWATTKLEKENKAKSTIKRERWNLTQLNREIGDRPLCEIAPPELLTAFRRVEARGRYCTVGRLHSTASRVFQFGVGASYCSSDPTRDLKHALTKAPKGNPRPALTDPHDVGDLMRRIDVYDAKNGGLVRYALKLIALTMVRPGELRLASEPLTHGNRAPHCDAMAIHCGGTSQLRGCEEDRFSIPHSRFPLPRKLVSVGARRIVRENNTSVRRSEVLVRLGARQAGDQIADDIEPRSAFVVGTDHDPWRFRA